MTIDDENGTSLPEKIKIAMPFKRNCMETLTQITNNSIEFRREKNVKKNKNGNGQNDNYKSSIPWIQFPKRTTMLVARICMYIGH